MVVEIPNGVICAQWSNLIDLSNIGNIADTYFEKENTEDKLMTLENN